MRAFLFWSRVPMEGTVFVSRTQGRAGATLPVIKIVRMDAGFLFSLADPYFFYNGIVHRIPPEYDWTLERAAIFLY